MMQGQVSRKRNFGTGTACNAWFVSTGLETNTGEVPHFSMKTWRTTKLKEKGTPYARKTKRMVLPLGTPEGTQGKRKGGVVVAVEDGVTTDEKQSNANDVNLLSLEGNGNDYRVCRLSGVTGGFKKNP